MNQFHWEKLSIHSKKHGKIYKQTNPIELEDYYFVTLINIILLNHPLSQYPNSFPTVFFFIISAREGSLNFLLILSNKYS